MATHGWAGHGVLGGRLALAVLLLQLLDLLKGEEGSAAAGPLLRVVLHPLLKLLRVAALDVETQVLLVLGGEVAEVAAEGLPACRGHQRLRALLPPTRGAAPPRPAPNTPNCYLRTRGAKMPQWVPPRRASARSHWHTDDSGAAKGASGLGYKMAELMTQPPTPPPRSEACG